MCEQVLLYMFLQQSRPGYQIHAISLLVTQELEQTTLLFRRVVCSVMPHGLNFTQLVRASFKSVFSLNILTTCLFT